MQHASCLIIIIMALCFAPFSFGHAATVTLRPATIPSRVGRGPILAQESEAERQERLKQLFGGTYQDEVARELARVTTVVQPQPVTPPPEWTEAPADGQQTFEWIVKRYSLWLEDLGVNLDNILLVPDGNRIAVVTSRDVSAGETLFEVPDALLLTADAAFKDPDVGRALRTMSVKDPGPGFDTFAIATLLAAERVRRGAVRGRLRRLEGGVLPKWSVKDVEAGLTNQQFSPFSPSRGIQLIRPSFVCQPHPRPPTRPPHAPAPRPLVLHLPAPHSPAPRLPTGSCNPRVA